VKHPLTNVPNPAGRLDVAAYRIAERIMEQLEERRGVRGLREHLLPLVESAIQDSLPSIPISKEMLAICRVLRLNGGSF
jgi:hypothetical protein